MRFVKVIKLTLSAFLLFSFSACEKIINLHLKDGVEQVVIEGMITNNKKECMVFISGTQPIDETTRFEGISNAIVTISDEKNKVTSLKEIEKGVYYDADLTAAYGQTYTLQVSLNNKTYRAQSIMPSTLVKLDSARVEYNAIFNSFIAVVFFHDPLNEENQYLFNIYKNNRKYNSFFAVNDEYINGKSVRENLPVFSNEEEDKLQPGDSVKIKMFGIDKKVYKYWYSLNAGALGGTGGPGSFGSPANPVSNITGGALGYFSAHTSQTEVIVVKP